MYDVRCTVYDVRCTVYDVRCTMYEVVADSAKLSERNLRKPSMSADLHYALSDKEELLA